MPRFHAYPAVKARKPKTKKGKVRKALFGGSIPPRASNRKCPLLNKVALKGSSAAVLFVVPACIDRWQIFLEMCGISAKRWAQVDLSSMDP